MKALRIPLGVWTWRSTALVLLLVLVPLLGTRSLVPDGDLLTAASQARGLLVGTATLAAGVLIYLHWRLTRHPASGRLTVLLAVAAAPAIALGALPAPPALAVRVVVPAVLVVTTALAVLRFAGVPLWARVRLAVGLLLLGLGTALGGLVALGAAVAGAVLLAGAAAALLRHAIEEEKLEVEELHQRLLTVEVGRRADRARLHEINATVAGIASAQQLMTQGLPLDRTDALSTMVRGEVERLQRLVSERGPSRRRSVDLDETIGRIVLSHLARGRIVVWERTGLRAVGRADEIAEILNILLENAAVHGGPDAVSVSVAPSPDGPGVTITVSDQGPGIAPDVRDRIFDWGVSGPDSPGQGIGLHLAASLAHELGGHLELLPATAGASFALHLEAAEAGMGAREHVA